MANNPPVDLSGEILDFRRVLSWTLTRKLYDLEKEIERIKLILYPEEEEISMSQPQVLSFTPDAEDYSEDQSGLKVVGHIDLTQFDPKKPKARERIGRHRLIMSGYYLSPKEEAEVFPERKALVESFLRNAAEDAGYVRDCFLLRSTLQYAVIRKEISNLNCDYYVIRQYAGELPSSNEIAAFLVDAYGGEKNLTRDLLTTLANRYSALSLLDAVCDNPFLRGRDPDFGQAKTIISDAIVGLGSGQVTFRKDMNAIMVALDNYVLQDLGIYISMAKKITRDAFSLVEFPLNEDKIEMLQFGQTAFSINLEGKDEYLKALTGALHEAEEKGCFTQNELSVISDNAKKRTSEDIELYIDPKDEDVAEYFLGLKKNLKNMVKIRKIAQILTEVGCIKSKQTPLLVYRLSGNCRPEKLNTISWIPRISRAKRHKSTPEEYRHPYELYYLLYHMYEESPVKYAEKVFSFFDFDDLTMKVRSAFYPAPKIAQLARATDRGFKERLHTVDGSVFPLPE